jgi:predicted nucleic acid-binding protein
VIGILIKAKKHNEISSLKKEFDKLIKKGNFWIDDKLIQKALKEVGEGSRE